MANGRKACYALLTTFIARATVKTLVTKEVQLLSIKFPLAHSVD